MLKNYLLIAFRNFSKYRLVAFINILGLSLGMAFSILAYAWVRDELSYDRFHPQAEQIFRIKTQIRNSFTIGTPSMLALKLKEEVPQIVETTETQFSGNEVLIKQGDNIFSEKGFLHVSSSFLKMFHFPLSQGVDSLALERPNTVIISEEIAEKYFPDTPPIGEQLVLTNGSVYEITGVFAPLPKQSTLQFNFLAPTSSIGKTTPPEDWNEGIGTAYVLAQSGYDQVQLSHDIQEVLKRNDAPAENLEFDIMPLTDVHLHAEMKFGETEGVQGDIRYVYVFISIGVLILLIACINFINLSTSRSMERAKEVGVRKAAGAINRQLMLQFMCESFLVVVFSLALGLMLAALLLPSLNALSGKAMTLHFLENTSLITACLFLLALVSILAGWYPSYILTSFHPVRVLKNSGMPPQSSSAVLRQVLVVFQFTISAMLVTATLMIWQQLNFIKTTRMGFSKDQIIVLNARHHSVSNYTFIKNKLEQMPGVVGVSSAPMLGFNNAWFNKSDSTGKEFSLYAFNVDDDFLDLLDVELSEGRPFRKNSSYDFQHAVILNQAAVEMLELSDPLGSKVRAIVKTDSGHFDFQEKEIIGVLSENVHFQSLKSEDLPLVMQLSENNLSSILIKISSEDMASTLDNLQKEWKKLEADFPFDYTFLDDNYARLYQQDRQMGRMFVILAVVAMIIAGLGLLGLSTYTVRKRRKEIGIRKVLGASLRSILFLLSKDYLKLILIALCIAVPVANYFMSEWLKNFVYHIEIQWWLYAVPGIVILMVALLSVSSQTLKAARKNPVDSLKYE